MFDTASLARYASLKARRAALEAELKEVKRELEGLGLRIIDAMTTARLTRVTFDDHTYHIGSSTYGSPAHGMPALIAALRESGLGDLVRETVSASTLGRYVRDLQEAGEPLPAPLEGEVAIYTKYRLL
jgi:hypothetical protein